MHGDEMDRARSALAELIPAAAGRLIAAKACMYTMTFDGHFAIGPHSRRAPAIGELAARMALELSPEFDLECLALERLMGCT